MDTQVCPTSYTHPDPRETQKSKFHPSKIYGQESVGFALLGSIFRCGVNCVHVCVNDIFYKSGLSFKTTFVTQGSLKRLGNEAILQIVSQ